MFWYSDLLHSYTGTVDFSPDMHRFEKQVISMLKGIPYSSIIRNLLSIYCEVFDASNPSSVFLKLWVLLEQLVSDENTVISNKEVIKRASYIFVDNREYHLSVLDHLRLVRNNHVHLGRDDPDHILEQYIHQLKYYVEMLLLYHLRRGKYYKSYSDAISFFDLPRSRSELIHLQESINQALSYDADAQILF